ncbi:PREDICTED: uncharacterized protein LOC105456828 [Wasmannia auropunctata]|uniref:uncharacterized protein LOC105456828 n=1 Tax=Wasmannia auropunctata TaxID=64793 RepID=UPI0005EE1502|nr:PREDICTED: uncharacterized protein LOC105456828 [Wasmannia auropunctata]
MSETKVPVVSSAVAAVQASSISATTVDVPAPKKRPAIERPPTPGTAAAAQYYLATIDDRFSPTVFEREVAKAMASGLIARDSPTAQLPAVDEGTSLTGNIQEATLSAERAPERSDA